MKLNLENTNSKAPFYFPVGNEKELFKDCFKSKLPLLIKGPTGCGKSRLVDAMAFELDLPLVTVSCNEDTTASDLLGRFVIKGNETIWNDGPVSKAVRTGGILYLDEVVEAREDVMVLIHSLSDYRRMLFIDTISEALKAPENFMLVMSYNPGYQRSFKELKPSTRQRFVAMTFQYPEETVEAKIIQGETGLESDKITKLVKLASKIRSLNELGLAENVSTRLLVNCAHLIKKGMEARAAAQFAIIEALSDDNETLKALKDLTALYL